MEPKEFDRIFHLFSPDALCIARAILKNREEAEEAVQDAFMRVFHSHEGFRREAKLKTWVSRIVINVCISRLHRRDRVVQGRVSLERANSEMDQSLESLEIFPGNPEDVFWERAIAHLPTRRALAITLYYYREYNYEQIAEVLNMSAGGVGALLNRSREELQALLKEKRKEIPK